MRVHQSNESNALHIEGVVTVFVWLDSNMPGRQNIEKKFKRTVQDVLRLLVTQTPPTLVKLTKCVDIPIKRSCIVSEFQRHQGLVTSFPGQALPRIIVFICRKRLEVFLAILFAMRTTAPQLSGSVRNDYSKVSISGIIQRLVQDHITNSVGSGAHSRPVMLSLAFSSATSASPATFSAAYTNVVVLTSQAKPLPFLTPCGNMRLRRCQPRGVPNGPLVYYT